MASDLSNLGNFLTVASVADAHRPSVTDTVLTANNGSATATITLLNTGSTTLASLVSHNSVVA